MSLRGLFKSRRSNASSHGSTVPSSLRASSVWLSADDVALVDGRSITGGMVYVGSGLPALKGYEIEPCLIDPSLSVHWCSPDWAGVTMDYWPAYERMDPRARAAYLVWLADGRCNESTYIGYVFVFFYGLERRLLADIKGDTSHPDLPKIAAEVRRLLEIYGDNRSFFGYANNLLEYVEALGSVDADIQPLAWDPEHRRWEVPVVVRIGIGRYLANALPIPGGWALSYLRHHPESYLRTPAMRCQQEFDYLFLNRYEAKFGSGIKVHAPVQKLKFSYRPASGGISGEADVTVDSIPDITSVSGPINELRDLGAECTDELDAYSRFLGRRPDEVETAAAVALLPKELLDAFGGATLDDLRGWTNGLLDSDIHAVVPIDDLVERWSPGRIEKLTKAEAVTLAAMLGKIDVGIEPDVRFGASTPKPGTSAVLFPLPENSPLSPSSMYAAAVSLVHLTAVVAAADGSITGPEQRHLAEHAEGVLGLDAAERARLEAHLMFLATGKLGMAGMKKKVEALPASDRVSVGRILVDVAAADGVVSPEEISTLTKLFIHLGLDETDVYSQVHALGVADAGPIAVRDAESTTRWTVPRPVIGDAATVRLDPVKVQARLAETAHVTALLAGIFSADEVSTQPPPPATGASVSSAGPTIVGLDAAHSALAVALAATPSWDRSDAEQLGDSLGLPLLNGALDRINEVAMDICGEPLVDGDDSLELNTYAIEEML
ncbi:MAG: hypothetical protein HN899_05365 [Gemmatimonadales bacterium]|nr:hypothetical protein [Gemmatimonadales bacterium]MBT7124573.1 hypothetical protein [Gemmatimonadales bacterium]MBT7691950.1 hypothetical protein [Gemmatimonadales bacterium]